MAVKKQETEAAVQAAPEKDTEVIRLFKDNQRYKTPVFVGVNGETYLIQRGVDVEVPKAVAEVLRHSEEMDGEAMAKIVAAESACVRPKSTALAKKRAFCKMKTDTRYSGTWLCRVFLQQRRLLAAAGRTQGAVTCAAGADRKGDLIR